jgi:hypothetical protein
MLDPDPYPHYFNADPKPCRHDVWLTAATMCHAANSNNIQLR